MLAIEWIEWILIRIRGCAGVGLYSKERGLGRLYGRWFSFSYYHSSPVLQRPSSVARPLPLRLVDTSHE